MDLQGHFWGEVGSASFDAWVLTSGRPRVGHCYAIFCIYRILLALIAIDLYLDRFFAIICTDTQN
jgi:hypothetical protein